MKKTILFLALILTATFAWAQNGNIETLWHSFQIPLQNLSVPADRLLNMVEKPDGNILIDVYFRTSVNVGNGFYTVSRQNPVVVDSTFLVAQTSVNEDNVNSVPLLIHNPDGEGYVYAKFLTDWKGFTWLEILRSDENMNFQSHGDAVLVPIEETSSLISKSIAFEDDSYLLLKYVVDNVPVIARIGLDGTVRDKKQMHGLFQGAEWKINGVETYSQTPREYAIYGWETTPNGDTTFLFHVVDSLFNLQETVTAVNQIGHYYYFNNMISLKSFDAQTYYVLSQYTKDNEPRNGLRITRYDKASHEQLSEILIRSNPMYGVLQYCAIPIGFHQSSDGNLYLAYRTCNMPNNGFVKAMKLTPNLETIWDKYCITIQNDESYSRFRSRTLTDGLMIGATHTWTSNYMGTNKFNTILFVVNDDGATSTPEMENQVCPVTHYPNPVSDILNLQYSPDVQPKQIELYDLQGRLVQTQSKNLESLNMAGLPAGTYTMRVMLENGKVFSDKVVKE